MSSEYSEPETQSRETSQNGARGEMMLAISNAIVRLLRDHAGRGPTHARTAISSEHAIVMLRGCLTRAEKTAAGSGNGATVIEMRKAVHSAMRAEAVAAVQEITGKEVLAYFTDQALEPDIAVAVFLFAEPKPLRAV